MNMGLNCDEFAIEDNGRFQWSIQKTIKIKAIPYLLSKLYELEELVDLKRLYEDFKRKYRIIESENVQWSNRSFTRTMFFIKSDLGLLENNYTLKPNVLDSVESPNLLECIYEGAMRTLVPFRIMIEIFITLDQEMYEWEDFKGILSRKLVQYARKERHEKFAKKEKKFNRNLHFWKMDDPSINRLVQLGQLLGICTFVVLDHIRFFNGFQRDDIIKTIDFERLIAILHKEIPDLNDTTIYTVDEIVEILQRHDIPPGIVEDAISSADMGCIEFFTGSKDEERYVMNKGKEYYRLRFTEETFEMLG